MIRRTGSFELSGTYGGPCIVTTKGNIIKVKNRSICSEAIDGTWCFCNKCQANVKSRFRTEAL